MNVAYHIARQVTASGQRSFSRVIIRIGIGSVALSIGTMIVATALITGFQQEIRNKIFGFWGHVHITDANVTRNFEVLPIDKHQDFYPSLDTVGPREYLEPYHIFGHELPYRRIVKTRGGVRHIQVYATKAGIIKAESEIEGIFLKGVGDDFDWDNIQRFIKQGERLDVGKEEVSKEILISEQTAKRLSLAVGDKLIIHFVENRQPIQRRFIVKGIFRTGLEEYDRRFALVDIRQLQNIYQWEEDKVGGFEVFIDDIRDLEVLSDYIYYKHIPNSLYAESIRRRDPEIFDWLEMQNNNMYFILTLMLIVAIINMITALLILILERTRMIGILKSLGAHNWTIRKVFLYHASWIILLGLIIGNVVGISICLLQDKFQFIRLSEADYYLSYAPIALNPWNILALNLGTLLITVLVLIIPSVLVRRISPVRALRFD